MITPQQIKTIHVASGRAGQNRQQYEMLLANVAKVKSCKQLDQTGFEDCMAVLEDLAGGLGSEPYFWRRIVERRGAFANSRMVHKINELYSNLQEATGLEDTHYELTGLVARVCQNRTTAAADLTPGEAWRLIEQLKKMIARLDKPDSDHATINQHHALSEAPF